MKDGITKDQSKMLQGLAILMMLYHHLFSTPEALGIEYRSLLQFGSLNIELHMAWFFKICVAIYAFVSGYGLCRGIRHTDNPDEGFFANLIKKYIFVLKKLLNFMIQYWLVFIIFVPIGFVFFGKPFDFKEFVLNFLGISSDYNGAWWYVFQYIKMLLLLPILDSLFSWGKNKRVNISRIVFFIVILGLIIALRVSSPVTFAIVLDFFQPAFLLCFVIGYLFSRFKIYEFFYKLIPTKILYFLGILGFLAVIVVRVKMAKDASSAGLDFVFVPIFAYGFCVIMTLLPRVSGIFRYLGFLSTFMWLTHVFYYDHYAKSLVMFSRFSTGIYITLLLLSVLTGIVLKLIYQKGIQRVIHVV